jgi:hypothetical protein
MIQTMTDYLKNIFEIEDAQLKKKRHAINEDANEEEEEEIQHLKNWDTEFF